MLALQSGWHLLNWDSWKETKINFGVLSTSKLYHPWMMLSASRRYSALRIVVINQAQMVCGCSSIIEIINRN